MKNPKTRLANLVRLDLLVLLRVHLLTLAQAATSVLPTSQFLAKIAPKDVRNRLPNPQVVTIVQGGNIAHSLHPMFAAVVVWVNLLT